MHSNSLVRGMPTHLTLFYSKRTGAIKKYTTGITDLFKAFGQAEGEELSLIYDTIVIDYDNDVINDYSNYIVVDGVVKKTNDPLNGVMKCVEEVKASSVESLNHIFDLDFRVLEIECTLGLPIKTNMKNVEEAPKMSIYTAAKTLILAGNYEREDMEYKLSVYLKRGRLTQEEHDELIAVM